MNIKDWIDSKGLNSFQFAKMVGISPASISYYVQGKSASLRIAKKIQRATNGEVTIKDLRPDHE